MWEPSHNEKSPFWSMEAMWKQQKEGYLLRHANSFFLLRTTHCFVTSRANSKKTEPLDRYLPMIHSSFPIRRKPPKTKKSWLPNVWPSWGLRLSAENWDCRLVRYNTAQSDWWVPVYHCISVSKRHEEQMSTEHITTAQSDGNTAIDTIKIWFALVIRTVML